MEIRKVEIPDTHYVIYSDGRLYSKFSKRFKKASDHKGGYLSYGISKNGKNKTIQAHRLVAKYFLSDFSEDKVVNHIDFNRKNNNVSNLEMVTVKENARHSANAGRYTRYGESNNNCRYSDETILMLRTYLNMGFSCAEISRKTGINRRYINGIKLGKRI